MARKTKQGKSPLVDDEVPKRRTIVCRVFVVICLLLVLVTVGVSLVFLIRASDRTENSKEIDDRPMTSEIRIYSSSIILTTPWEKTLENPSSYEYHQRQKILSKRVDLAFSVSALRGFYLKTKVESMGPADGVTWVDLLMFFECIPVESKSTECMVVNTDSVRSVLSGIVKVYRFSLIPSDHLSTLDTEDLLSNQRVRRETDAACGVGRRLCDDGSCVFNAWWCNGYEDCRDGSDESRCFQDTFYDTTTTAVDEGQEVLLPVEVEIYEKTNSTDEPLLSRPGSDFTCRLGSFQCDNEACIPDSWVCDNVTDCTDGSDETEKACEISSRRVTLTTPTPTTTTRDIPKMDVRLVNSVNSSSFYGRVEVLHDGEWGTVCDDYWDDRDAAVVCRTLNHTGASFAVLGASYGRGNGKIWLDGVQCDGTEEGIELCPGHPVGEVDCSHSEDAGVYCQPEIEAVRLVGLNDYQGRVELFVEGRWGKICTTGGWDENAAQVVCRMLNISGSAYVYNAFSRLDVTRPNVWVSGITCSGSESSLSECTHQSGLGDFIREQTSRCFLSDTAGVSCGVVGCDAGYRSCADNETCYQQDQHCDGELDCPDFSDELDCASSGGCRSGLFSCDPSAFSSSCISISRRCDGVFDCDDGRDELLCVKKREDGVATVLRSGEWQPLCYNETLAIQIGESFCRAEVSSGLFKINSVPEVEMGWILDPSNSTSVLQGFTFRTQQLCAVFRPECHYPSRCGLRGPRSVSSFIVNGNDAHVGEWRWQIRLHRKGIFGCGGSIISSHWVLTAGHCVRSFISSELDVYVGDHKQNSKDPTEVRHAVRRVILHPRMRLRTGLSTYLNDIALLELRTPIQSNAHTGPVCLPDPQLVISDHCFISGWGRLSRYGSSPDILQDAKVEMYNASRCNTLFPRLQSPVPNMTVCVTYHTRSSPACRGDSGGPLVCKSTTGRWVLMGASSYGPTLCSRSSSDARSVYTSVQFFLDWIKENIERTCVFKCDEGSRCIESRADLCNGKLDCRDETDESVFCGANCTFEQRIPCGYKNLTSFVVGQKFSTKDHTRINALQAGSYIYHPGYSVSNGSFFSPNLSLSGDMCLEMYLFTPYVNTSFLVTAIMETERRVLITVSNGRRISWRRVLVDVPQETKTLQFTSQIALQTSKSLFFIAVDDISMFSAPCPSIVCERGYVACRDGRLCIDSTQVCDYIIQCPDGSDEDNCTMHISVDCDFEHQYLCGYFPEKVHRQQYFFTDIHNISDHTFKQPSGHLLFFEREGSSLRSPVIHVNMTSCFEFYYVMDRKNGGRFHVWDNTSRNNFDTLLWQIEHRQGRKWRLGQIILPRGVHQLMFNVTSDIFDIPNDIHILLDDMKLREGNCSTNVNNCDRSDFRCNNGQCIDIDSSCDAIPNCRDESDMYMSSTNASSSSLRLVNGNSESGGMLEIFHNAQWRGICFTGWTNSSAEVACRALGYRRVRSSYYKLSDQTGPRAWLRNVVCLGNETRLDDCPHDPWRDVKCRNNMFVRIECGDPRCRSSLQVSESTTLKSFDRVRLRDGATSQEGRVEVLYGNQWGTICNDSWTSTNTRTVCKTLGYRGNSVTIDNMTPGTDLIWLDEVECQHSSVDIFECRSGELGFHDCDHYYDVAVRCVQGCTDDQMLCADNRTCIRPGLICDGQLDCPLGDDEVNCASSCSVDELACDAFSLCVHPSSFCDGVMDCLDGTDEMDCARLRADGAALVSLDDHFYPMCYSESIGREIANSFCRSMGHVGAYEVISSLASENGLSVRRSNGTSILPGFSLSDSSNCSTLIPRCVQHDCGVKGAGYSMDQPLFGIASPGEWKWHVDIYWEDSLMCSGTIVAAKWILATLNCVRSLSQANIEIFAGLEKAIKSVTTTTGLERTVLDLNLLTELRVVSRLTEGNEESLRVRNINFAPGFDSANNSVILLELRSSIQFSDYTGPVCTAVDSPTSVTSLCYVTNSQLSAISKVSLYDFTTCTQLFPSVSDVNLTDYICATYNTSRSPTCDVQDGSAVVCATTSGRWMVLGLAYGSGETLPFGCQRDNGTQNTALFMPLQPIVSWITQSIGCEFACDEDRCINDPNKLCDGTYDCMDKTDETALCGVNCTFEEHTCGYRSVLTAQSSLAWRRQDGTNGPPDHTLKLFTGSYFMHNNSDLTQGKNSTAVLISPVFSVQNHSCFEFYYYMSTDNLTLNVRLTSGDNANISTEQPIRWSLSNRQGSKWRLAQIPVNGNGTFRTHFEAVTFNVTSPVAVAIDDARLIDGPCLHTVVSCDVEEFQCFSGSCIMADDTCDDVQNCPDRSDINETLLEHCNPSTRQSYSRRILSCNFEDAGLCRFTQDTTDDFNWTWHSGQTRSLNTGPTYDHTFNNASGHYLYIESTNQLVNGKARLFSVSLANSGSALCLQFYFHMYGSDMGTLNVYLTPEGQTDRRSSPLWSRSSNLGNSWKEGRVILHPAGRSQTTASRERLGLVAGKLYIAIDIFWNAQAHDIPRQGNTSHSCSLNIGIPGLRALEWRQLSAFQTIVDIQRRQSNSYIWSGAEQTLLVIFEGVVGSDYKSDLAIDDISIVQGECSATNRANDIRLVNGFSTSEGRVEILHAGVWGTICDDRWDKQNADVVCRMLGYRSGEAFFLSKYGKGVGKIWLDEVNCVGNESHISLCNHNPWGVEDCSHLEDAGVRCSGPAEHTPNSTSSSSPVRSFVTVKKVRLRDGATLREGRVELFLNNQWGTVCNDGWGEEQATAVCNTLGFRGRSVAIEKSVPGSGPIWLDDVQCSSSNADIFNCESAPEGRHDCTHYEDAAVRCQQDCGENSNLCSDEKSCVSTDLYCDGELDCPDGGDEANCASICSVDELICDAFSLCVPPSSRCDGVMDCLDGTDEIECLGLREDGVAMISLDGQRYPLCYNETMEMTMADSFCRVMGEIGAYEAMSANSTENGVRLQMSLRGSILSTDPITDVGFCHALVPHCVRKDCGIKGPSVDTIFVDGIREATPGEWPWQVVLRLAPGDYGCNGVLISSRWILTVEACSVNIDQVEEIIVEAVNGAQIYHVKQIVKSEIGPQFFRVILMELSSEVHLSEAISPVCLPDEVTAVTSTCYLTGADISTNGGNGPILEAKVNPQLIFTDCKRDILDTEKDKVLCASSSRGINPCQFNLTGGSLVCRTTSDRWVLQGIYPGNQTYDCHGDSRGKTKIIPTIAPLIPWIKDNIGCMFACDVNRCINEEDKICDGQYDCRDKTDETSYCSLFNCTFEFNKTCGYNASWSANSEGWRIDRSTTDKPITDHTTGTSQGYYMAAYGGRDVNNTVTVVSSELDISGDSCLQLYFFMGAVAHSELEISAIQGNVSQILGHMIARSSSSRWHLFQSQLPTGLVQITLLADTDSFVAVDDIAHVQGRCPSLNCDSVKYFACRDDKLCVDGKVLCDGRADCLDGSDEMVDVCSKYITINCQFEHGYNCGYLPTGSDQTGPGWQHTNGSMDVPLVPRHDHTYKFTRFPFNRFQGHYMISHANGTMSTGLRSPVFTVKDSSCLEFYYYMPLDGATLDVLLTNHSQNSNLSSLAWSLSNSQGERWRLAQIPLSLGILRAEFRTVLALSNGTNATPSQIFVALDDTRLRKGSCVRSVISCAEDELQCDSGSCIMEVDVCNGVQNCPDDSETRQNCSEERKASVIVSDAVRLVDGSTVYEGRVEILHSGVWGTICDDSWSISDAIVVCRMLGFSGGRAFSEAFFGQGTGRTWLDELRCTGDESDLADCPSNLWGAHDCSHGEDAGVRCESSEGGNTGRRRAARLPTETVKPERVRLQDGRTSHDGRVEVFIKGAWGTVCNDGLTNNFAKSICSNLGYRGKAFLLGEADVPGTGRIWFDNLACDSSGCQFDRNGTHDCDHYEDAAVQCVQECPVEYMMCSDGFTCIPKRWRCDHVSDCPMGDDEILCSQCSGTEFVCRNYDCVPGKSRCDGNLDCSDGTDESACVRQRTDRIVELLHGDQWLPLCVPQTEGAVENSIEAMSVSLAACNALGYRAVSSIVAGPQLDAGLLPVARFNETTVLQDFQLLLNRNCSSVNISCTSLECGRKSGGNMSDADRRNATEIPNKMVPDDQAFPWVVSILVNGDVKCSGALISDTWVVTSAHCVDGVNNYSSVKMTMAQNQTRGTEQIVIHQGFVKGFKSSNIALLRLSSSVEFGELINSVCLDDQLTLTGDCLAVRTTKLLSSCDFENLDLCGYQDTTDDFDWTWQSGETPSEDTGPNFDHTFNTISGHYMYIEASGRDYFVDRARLFSVPITNFGSTFCLQFYFHMYGRDMGTLNVYLAPEGQTGQRSTPQWTQSFNQGNRWIKGQVDLHPSGRSQVIFEGLVGTGFKSDIAIDDISIQLGACSKPAINQSAPLRTFQEQVNVDIIDVDHCRERFQGFVGEYVCAYTGRSRLEGAVLMCKQPTQQWELVGVYASGLADETIFTSISNFREWITKTTECPFECDGSKCLYNISAVCDGIRDCGDGSDENIHVCDPSVSCTFDYGNLCGYKRSSTTPYAMWMRTGTNTFGSYMYIGNTSTIMIPSVVMLVSPSVNGDDRMSCVQFRFHMSHTENSRLRLAVSLNTSSIVVFSATGNHGDNWSTQHVLLPPGTTRLVFVADVVDFGFIAVDDVNFWKGGCEQSECSQTSAQCSVYSQQMILKGKPYEGVKDFPNGLDQQHCPLFGVNCAFESVGLCGYQAMVGPEEFNVTWRASSMYREDHTTRNHTGHYIELTLLHGQDSHADIFVSVPFSLDNDSCAEFYYRSYANNGTGIGQLTAGTSVEHNMTVLWRSGYEEPFTIPVWRLGQVNLTAGSYRLVFGMDNHAGPVDIDDIRVITGPCSSSVIACRPSEMVCPGHQCIPKSHRCDGILDCPDRSDEANCSQTERGIRLVGGGFPWQGRVEVYHNDNWNAICIDRWTALNLELACTQLGFSPSNTETVPCCKFGSDVLPNTTSRRIHVFCEGTDRNFASCERKSGVVCSNDNRITGITCGKPANFTENVRLVGPVENEGRVEVFHDGHWSPVCSEGWDVHDASVVCRMMGYTTYHAEVYSNISNGEALWLKNVNCWGNESRLDECPNGDWGRQCEPSQYAGVRCLGAYSDPSETIPVRLIDDVRDGISRVEVYHRGRWGVVCSDRTHPWYSANTNVICKSLGFDVTSRSESLKREIKSDADDLADLPVLLIYISCSGNERNISECRRSPWAGPGFTCPSFTSIRSCGPIAADKPYNIFLESDMPGEGKLIIKSENQWGTVCGELDVNAAAVVCRMKGYRNVTAEVISADETVDIRDAGSIDEPVWFVEVNCTGQEDRLEDCLQFIVHISACTHADDIGVRCRGAYVNASAVPSYGITRVRLSEGTSSTEGRVEVMINDTWGTVCKTHFNAVDAKAVCSAIMNRPVHGVEILGEVTPGSGPVHVGRLACTPDHQSALNCTDFRGNNELCNHYDDVGVRCIPGCLETEFRCDTGLCLDKAFKCNGQADCPNADDESSHCVNCDSAVEFQCDSGFCVNSSLVCDGVPDCLDSSDELGCEQCMGFQCDNDRICVPLNWKCDFLTDCADLTDETDCDCGEFRRKCRNGLCMFTSKWCNGEDDCLDGSDEDNCTCTSEERACASGQCVMSSWFCDGYKDCLDGSDETNCSSCQSGEYVCRDYSCAPTGSHCNGTHECPDQSDEVGCVSLEGSNSTLMGLIKVLRENNSLHVCKDGWTNEASTDICEDMGHSTAKSTMFVPAQEDQFLVMTDTSAADRANTTLGSLTRGTCPSKQAVHVTCQPKDCGSAAHGGPLYQSFVVGGQLAKPGMWPWMALLSFQNTPRCGATVIDATFIVTAAHCVSERRLPFYFSVLTGTVDKDQTGDNAQIRTVDRIYVHPNFSNTRAVKPFDIAVLHLKTPLSMTEYVKPICLSGPESNLPKNANCFVTGFGSLKPFDRRIESKLREGKVKLWSDGRCVEAYTGRLVPQDKLCAGYATGSISPCFGDSGGPLMCQTSTDHWTLAGVTSIGEKGCRRGTTFTPVKPSAFTRISTYLPWIKEVTRSMFG